MKQVYNRNEHYSREALRKHKDLLKKAYARKSDLVCLECGLSFLQPREMKLYQQGKWNVFYLDKETECGICENVKKVAHMRSFNYLGIN